MKKKLIKLFFLATIILNLSGNLVFAQDLTTDEEINQFVQEGNLEGLNDLYNQGLISNDQYNSAISDYKKKHSLDEATFDLGEAFRLPGTTEENTKYFNTNRPPIVEFLLSVITFATQIIGSIAVILFIVAGFTFIFSQGNEQGVTKAKEIVSYATIGLVVTFLSYIIVIFIQTLFSK